MAEKNGSSETGLREHLMLDTLAEVGQAATTRPSPINAVVVAREVLGRIAEPPCQATGRSTLIEERSLTELDKQLRRWAAAPVEAGPPEGEELLPGRLLERFRSQRPH